MSAEDVINGHIAMSAEDVINGRLQILSVCFKTLTDTFHTPIFNTLSKLLITFVKIMEGSGYPQNALIEDMLNVMNDFLHQQIKDYLRNNSSLII